MADRRKKLLKGFDRRSAPRRNALARSWGPEVAGEILAEARQQFDELVDEIPYKGREGDVMGRALIVCYEFLCFHLALKRRGRSLEEIGGFIDESSPVPRWIPGWLVRFLAARSLLRRRFRKAAARSQERAHTDEFVWEFIDGEDAETDFGINILSCAICKAFSKHGAQEVVPYLCAIDDKTSDAFGLGLRRSGTIALGAHRCDFRYKLGGKPSRLRDQYSLPTVEG